MKRWTTFAAVSSGLIAAALLAGCAKEPEPEATTPEAEPEVTQPDPAADLPTMPIDGEEVVVFETGEGRIVIMLYPQVAPKHVEQFKNLVGQGFYDGTRFHRNIAGFMIQGGDPNSKDLAKSSVWGTGGYMVDGREVNIPAEFSKLEHVRGVVSAARSQDIDSASSQFFICVDDARRSLDGNYSAFGRVVEGMDVADKIVATGDPMQDGATVPTEAIVLKKAELKTWPLDNATTTAPGAGSPSGSSNATGTGSGATSSSEDTPAAAPSTAPKKDGGTAPSSPQGELPLPGSKSSGGGR